MKNLYFLLALVAVTACNKSTNKTPYVILKGEIKNHQENTLVVKGNGFEQEIEVNNEGKFQDTLFVEENYYTISHNREYTAAYLKPGFVLHLAFNTVEFDESVAYNGIGAIENNFLARKYLTMEKALPATPELYALNSEQFLDKITNFRNAIETSLAGYEFSEEFKMRELKNITYDYIASIQKYPSYHKHFAPDDTVAIDSTMLIPLQYINMDYAEDYDMFANYRDIVKRHYMEALADDADAKAMIDGLNNYESENIRSGLAKNLIYYLSPTEPDMEQLYQGLLAASMDEAFKSKLTEKYNKLKVLVEGKKSPAFAYKNTNGEIVSLADLKGNLVYIDVWATWCGPCKREIPFLKELEGEYKNKAIKFVSISIDKEKDHQKWLDMVEEKELKGIQLFADKDWSSSFVKGYAIDGIPRFILIDKEGNIISADAPRPSSNEKIRNLINENLKS